MGEAPFTSVGVPQSVTVQGGQRVEGSPAWHPVGGHWQVEEGTPADKGGSPGEGVALGNTPVEGGHRQVEVAQQILEWEQGEAIYKEGIQKHWREVQIAEVNFLANQDF